MSVSEKGDQKPIYQVCLADNVLAQIGSERLNRLLFTHKSRESLWSKWCSSQPLGPPMQSFLSNNKARLGPVKCDLFRDRHEASSIDAVFKVRPLFSLVARLV